MAADWIPMRVDLLEDPAVISIAMSTGLDEFAVVGRLQCLWSWANTHTTNGHAAVTLDWLDAKMRAEKFSEAMISAGWLRAREGGIVFPRFDRWNSQAAKKRVLATRRKQRERTRRQRDIERDTLATRGEESRGEEYTPTDNQDLSSPSEARKPKSSRARSGGKKFVVPTVEEVAAYCRERKNGVDAQRFVDHYTTNDWKRGKTAISDWQACVRTWESNQGGQHVRGSSQNVGQSRVPVPDGKLELYEARTQRVDASAPPQ